jgi:integrase
VQRGTIIKHHGAWALRYWETIVEDGQHVRRKAFRRLASVSEEYPNKRSVLLLAEKILAPVNTGLQAPESSMSVVGFIENVYLPYVLKERAPATYKNYKKDLFEKHLKKLLDDVRLRDFRTIHGQRILRGIQPPKDSSGRTTLVRAKAFLSSVFKHAKREGFLDGENPMRDTSVPGRPEKPEVKVYSMSEIEKISEAVAKDDLTAFTVIAVAAFAGLRQSEIRGLKWSDYDGTSIKISRSVWRTHIGPPKTEGSLGVVPVLPFLQGFLNEHRARTKFAKDDDYIFSGERRGAPLNLANLARRVIIPALAKSEEMKSRLIGAAGIRSGDHLHRICTVVACPPKLYRRSCGIPTSEPRCGSTFERRTTKRGLRCRKSTIGSRTRDFGLQFGHHII